MKRLRTLSNGHNVLEMSLINEDGTRYGVEYQHMAGDVDMVIQEVVGEENYHAQHDVWDQIRLKKVVCKCGRNVTTGHFYYVAGFFCDICIEENNRALQALQDDANRSYQPHPEDTGDFPF